MKKLVSALVKRRKLCATRSVASTIYAGHRFILGPAYILSPGIKPVRAGAERSRTRAERAVTTAAYIHKIRVTASIIL